MKPWSAPRRSFLFLQGPHGPFFFLLGQALQDAGYQVHRINFCGGDRKDWPQAATNYTGRSADWPLFVDNFIVENGITDVVLFGDCRTIHRVAHGMAHLRKARTYVFEEGYIRPDFVTLELDGVNGNSSLSRDPDWYLQAARVLPPVPVYPAVASSFGRRAQEALAYHTATALERPRFRHYKTHRPISSLAEGWGWAKRFSRRARERERSRIAMRQIQGRPYFCFPLQLDSDHQIRIHSPFGNMAVGIRYVLDSFSRGAPADVCLLVKLHPLDACITNWRKVVEDEANRRGIFDRVFFVEHGDVAPMVANALGVVTVNSTTGTLALREGVPTAVLGHAVYDMPRVTHQGTLDSFWRAPTPPEAAVYDAFCRVLVDRCLIHGGFLSEMGLQHVVQGSVARLTADDERQAASIRADFALADGRTLPA